jgi:hypothetical protein
VALYKFYYYYYYYYYEPLILIDEPTKKFGEIPSIIKGIIALMVFEGLAPWWQSGEADVADSSMQHTFDLSSITPPNQSFKNYRAEGNLTAVFVFFTKHPLYDRKINKMKKTYDIT